MVCCSGVTDIAQIRELTAEIAVFHGLGPRTSVIIVVIGLCSS